MTDNDQTAAVLAGIMSTFGDSTHSHPAEQLPVARALLDAIRAGKVPTIFHTSHIPALFCRHEQETRAEKARADKAEAERDAEKELNAKWRAALAQRDRDTAERDRCSDAALRRLCKAAGVELMLQINPSIEDMEAEIRRTCDAQRDRLAGLLGEAVHAIDTRFNKSLVSDIKAALAEVGKS